MQQCHVITLDDEEKAVLQEILVTTLNHFSVTVYMGEIIDVPQTEAIKAYKAQLQSVLNAVNRS